MAFHQRGGGSAAQLIEADLAEIILALYDSNEDTLSVQATSDAPVDTVTLTADVIFESSTIKSKPMKYKFEEDYYQKIFKNIASEPDSVTVVSNGGGSDSEAVPFPPITPQF